MQREFRKNPFYPFKVVIYFKIYRYRIREASARALTADQLPTNQDEHGFSKQLSLWFGMVLLTQ